MFKGHPKGLYVAFFSNMGERFGFYTMMAILVMFLQAKFNLDASNAGFIYSVFYFSIYALALLGGFIADKSQNYKGVINVGIVIMFAGYVIMAIPGLGLPFALIGLFTIALGNGLFKGNLQALVGQMYDAPEYSKLRDTAYSIFYMGINIGAAFAPNAARYIRTWYLGTNGFKYDADLPGLCNQMIDGTLAEANVGKLQMLADFAKGTTVTDLSEFAKTYINTFSIGYNYAFGIAAIAMLISLATYIIFKRHLPDKRIQAAKEAGQIPQMSKEEEKKRIWALILVFLVVIFFWMSFHQNGLTMTFFARDYTAKTVDSLTNVLFNIWSLIAVTGAIFGLVYLLKRNSTAKDRGLGAALLAGGGIIAYMFYKSFDQSNLVEPETFQQFNALFVVALTPAVVSIFAKLRSKDMEPSTPKKIGTGMILAAFGFTVLLVGSLGLVSPAELAGQPSPDRVSPYWLISTYFILTVAELFLSPMGLSFVSKVAPPRFQGLMQGGWLGATALGNQLLWVGSSLWTKINIWQVWLIFVICCLISATFIFYMMKRLEQVTKQ